MAQKTTEFGDFVDQVLLKIFFQPDDELSVKTIKETFAPDFEARLVVSHDPKFHFSQP